MNVHLTAAMNDSDQVRDLVSGRVSVEGIDLTCLLLEVEEIFFRFTKFREWDVSELSMGKYCSLRARGDDSLVGLPVFLSRSFRHSGIFIRHDGPVDNPSALAGARIGFPEWTVTATVYQRALLQHEYGIDLTTVQWVQGGVNTPGRIETLPIDLPAGMCVRAETERSLNDMLLAGELDAVMVPRPPAGFENGAGPIVTLFSDAQAVEEEYFHRTSIFPIMHLLVVRRDIVDKHPWIPRHLVAAFTAAKDRSLTRLLDATAPHFPLPWGVERARQATHSFGPDLWPYGVDANRPTLDAFLGYAHEQGLCQRRLDVAELFPPTLGEEFRI
jgi:4,5-dihydroxyphthalate decarboxylase